MDRITKANLDHLVSRINDCTQSPAEPWTRAGAKFSANIGNYHLSGAYGGVSLHRMQNDGGGITDVFSCGHTTRRDLYNRMRAFLDGLHSNPRHRALTE